VGVLATPSTRPLPPRRHMPPPPSAHPTRFASSAALPLHAGRRGTNRLWVRAHVYVLGSEDLVFADYTFTRFNRSDADTILRDAGVQASTMAGAVTAPLAGATSSAVTDAAETATTVQLPTSPAASLTVQSPPLASGVDSGRLPTIEDSPQPVT